MVKAICLFSGGLDSLLAVKLLQEQSIEIILLHLTSVFEKTITNPFKNLKIITKDITKEQLKLIKNPKYGYGSAINPCIDCKILMFKIANKYMKKLKASFVFTGEVLGERPMTQNKGAMLLIQKKSGLKSKLLRPLSAKLLEETEPEKKGYVDRNKLLSIYGRSRKIQLELAKRYKLKEFPTPAGGCLLTDIPLSKKLKDLIKHKKSITYKDLELLKIGRHFRLNKSKIIVGRKEEENKKLLKLKDKADYTFEVADCVGPITILQGEKTKKAVELAAALTAEYSDAKGEKIMVNCNKKKIIVKPIDKQKALKYKI